MQIANISSFASIGMALNPLPVTLLRSGPSSSAAALPALLQVSGPSSSSAVTDGTTLNHEIEYVKNLQTQSAQAQGAASSAAEDLQVSGYTTRVNGTQYSGIVDESGAEYIASVPSLLGAIATGVSVGVAEINLGFRIDELV
jgi:hypothetical protein